jgi:hypothetical protein
MVDLSGFHGMINMQTIVIPYSPRFPQTKIHPNLENHRFSVLVAHRRMGKTVCVINHLIKQAVKFKRTDGRFAYIAPFRHQAKSIAWDYVKHYTSPIPGIRYNESELTVDFPNGSRIRLFGADNPDAMRGMYFDGVVMDEVADMKPEVWGEIIRPALADRTGWCVFIGTPKGLNQFYELYQYSKTTDGWYGDIYRADDTRVLPEDELNMARDTMSDMQYRQEFLCDFSASCDNVLITIDIVAESVKRDVQEQDIRHSPKVMGVDVARFGDDRSALVKRQGLLGYNPMTWKDIDNMTLAARVAQEIENFQPDTVFIDAGRGEGVIDRLRQLGYKIIEINFGGKPIDPIRYTNKRTEMWDGMKKWLESGGQIPNDRDLKSDLVVPTYSFDSSNRMRLESKEKIKESGRPSPDLGDALALTFAAPVASKQDMLESMGLGKIRTFKHRKQKYDPFDGI